MRVGFDLNPMTSHRTGEGNYCYYVLKALADLYPETQLFGFSSGSVKVDLGKLASRVVHRHMAVPSNLLTGWWSAFGKPEVDRLLGGLDVYHATNFLLPPTARAARILMIHDLAFLARPALCDPAIVKPLSRKARKSARDADGLLVNSNATKKDVVQYLDVDPAKIVVAPVGVDDELCPMLPESAKQQVERKFNLKSPFILFVGTLETRKNPVNLVKAFARLAAEVPHNLVLIGERGYGAGEVFQAVAQLGLEKRVIEMGYLPDYLQLRAFYSAADVLVFPSRYEGFGLPVLEAMACGCPVVTSADPAMREIAGEAALYADTESVESLAATIRRVLHEPDTREDMTVLGQDRAKSFSWENCAKATHELYQQCAALI